MSDERRELLNAGYVLLPVFFDARPLTDELDRAMTDGFGPTHGVQRFSAGAETVAVRYLPMMSELTPVSLDLARALGKIASELLDRPVLPGRAKGSTYHGDTCWHRDNEHDVGSLGCVAYLDPLTAKTGALRVLPGSHTNRGLELPEDSWEAGVAVETVPGDVIVLDEHLIHGSSGGRERRQWRTDFVIDPVNQGEIEAVRRWFAQSLPDERCDPGYDARRYGSYGTYWRSRHPTWTARLVDLGVLGEPSFL